jgi:HSP20 family protein
MVLRNLVPWRGRRDLPVRRVGGAYSPFYALQHEMNRLFEDAWRGFDLPAFGALQGGFEPRVDVRETESEIRVTAEIPGLDEKDFEIQLQGDVLFLRGEKRVEREHEGAGWYERSYGRFERAIELPAEVDAEKASASYKAGVLHVTLPKTETARARTIPIQTS